MRLLVFFSTILVTFSAYAGPYEVHKIVVKNPELTKRFDFLKHTAVNNKVTIAVIGDYIHTDTFKHLIDVNESEIPDNNIDDDGNGFVDDSLGLNMNTRDGHLKAPVVSGHENGIVSLLDAFITDNRLTNTIRIIPINVTSERLQFDEIYIKKIADAIDYAVLRGAKVISMSLGVSEQATAFFEFIEKDQKKSLAYYEAAIQRAVSAGVIMLGAVSNDPALNQAVERNIPSNSNGVLAVANANFDGIIQSAYGTNIHVAYYGTGLTVWNGEKQGYRVVKGSSFSTPLIAFIAAIGKSLHPELTSADLAMFGKACEKRIVSKKNIASKCVFSPEKFIQSLK